MVLILCFINNTVLSCFFLFFLIIDVVLFFLIVVVVVVFNVFVIVAAANDDADGSFDVAVVAGALSLLLVWIAFALRLDNKLVSAFCVSRSD